jgi:hypothetical protein
MKLKNFFCRFPNPWTLRVSGMGGYASKCEKKSKSLHPIAQAVILRVAVLPWPVNPNFQMNTHSAILTNLIVF